MYHHALDSPLSEKKEGKEENLERLLQKYRITRRERDATVVNATLIGVMAIPTHGHSLFGLVFTIPRFLHHQKKVKDYRRRLLAAGIKPPRRTKRDYVLPVVMGAGSTATGILLTKTGAADVVAGPIGEAFANAAPMDVGDLMRELNISLGQTVVNKGLDLLFEGVLYPFNRVKKSVAAAKDAKVDLTYSILHEGVKDMLLQWALLGDEKDAYGSEEELLKAMGHSKEEMLHAIEHLDELIRKVMEDVFDQEEREIIDKYLTDNAIFGVMNVVFTSSQYQELGQQDDGEVLRWYFKHLVLGSVNQIRKEKQIVQGFGRDSLSPIHSEKPIHYGIKCNSCGDMEIKGVRYQCGSCEEGVNYCYECFFVEVKNEDHVMQHKWIVFYAGTQGSVPDSPTTLDETSCVLCQESIREDRFRCQECDQFDVCQVCFQEQGKTLHETHGFVLLSPWGFTLVDRDGYFGAEQNQGQQ